MFRKPYRKLKASNCLIFYKQIHRLFWIHYGIDESKRQNLTDKKARGYKLHKKDCKSLSFFEQNAEIE